MKHYDEMKHSLGFDESQNNDTPSKSKRIVNILIVTEPMSKSLSRKKSSKISEPYNITINTQNGNGFGSFGSFGTRKQKLLKQKMINKGFEPSDFKKLKILNTAKAKKGRKFTQNLWNRNSIQAKMPDFRK